MRSFFLLTFINCIDKDIALQVLSQNGITVASDKDSLEKIAKANNLSPLQLYQQIQPLAPENQTDSNQNWTHEKEENELEGKGIGRRNIVWLVENYQLERSVARNRLAKAGISAEADETFRKIADRYQVSPLDIAKIILIENLEK